MYSSSNALFVQGVKCNNDYFIVSMQFLSIVSYYLLKWALMILEENMLVREKKKLHIMAWECVHGSTRNASPIEQMD